MTTQSTPLSDVWKGLSAEQQPQYDNQDALDAACAHLRSCPPLVFAREIDALKKSIADAGEGKSFILQGGNCAERFSDCTETTITNQLKILLQMSVILTHGIRRPVVRIGRIAGQYAKPRSAHFEQVNGKEMPVYRGDAVNNVQPDITARKANPERLIRAYYSSAATLNFIRSMIDGGFADLHYPYNWNLHSMEATPEWPVYKSIVEDILTSIDFMESFGGVRSETLGRVDFYTSHEGLLLPYEDALTRRDDTTGKWYNMGAHTVWIGNRTRACDGAHVAYFSEIANPIGIKIDATIEPDELVELVHILNPQNQPGRITIISRCGSENVEKGLTPLIKATQKNSSAVVWSCDPMHGNTRTTDEGTKTRDFDKIMDELRATFRIHAENGSRLTGVHFELTGDDVTECIGGAVTVRNEDLGRNYTTYCDPRLNYMQSMEVAFLIAEFVKTHG